MAKAAISVQQSRFALLKVDDDSDLEENKKSNDNVKQSQQNVVAKKKKNKKKRAAHDSDHGEGKPGSKGRQGKDDQWQVWHEKDQRFVEEQFQKDLEKALLESQIMKEKKIQEQKTLREIMPDLEASGGGDAKDGKKKKKKDKPVTMSLEQFNQFGEEGAQRAHSHAEARVPPTPDTPREASEHDKEFFRKVEEDTSRILRQEKIQEEYQKHFAAEFAMSSKYTELLAKKDEEIKVLKNELETTKEELEVTKKRSVRYLKLLSQGEIKEKSLVIKEKEDLAVSNKDLNEQVLSLTSELEKERTLVHTLQKELQRLKGHKHGGK